MHASLVKRVNSICLCSSTYLCSIGRKHVVIGAVPTVSVRVGELHRHQRIAVVALLSAVGTAVVDAEQPRVGCTPGHLGGGGGCDGPWAGLCDCLSVRGLVGWLDGWLFNFVF